MNALAPFLRRSPEEAALMNPAFIAVVVHYGVHGFEQETGLGMPYALPFLVPPVVMVENTRALLPRRKDSSLAAWLQDHPDIRLRFSNIATSMVPVVREGLLFASSKGLISFTCDRIKAVPLPRGSGPIITANTQEFQEILKKANFVGKWYANSGSTETIMALWGVRP